MPARTPSQTVGPYFTIGLDPRAQNALVDSGLTLRGRVLDGNGDPLPDAMLEVWDRTHRRWGRCGTDAEGGFTFTIAKPDAQDGDAPRLDVYVFARGLLRHQLTRIYFPDEAEANAADRVLSKLTADQRATLVAHDDGGGLRHDIRLQGDDQTVFFEH
jgi:protocatechuate 3,4-dioxygenase alpha subunit